MGRIDVRAEEAIARLAAANDEVIARSALLHEEVRSAAIDDRVRSGRLQVLYTAVYFAGNGEPSRLQRLRAAAVACGHRAVLRRLTASELWRLLSAHPGPPEVLVVGPRRRGPAGVALARTTYLPPQEVTEHQGIPVTTPARTLLDLAATDHAGLEEALDEAFALRLVRREELDGLATSGRRGSARLRALLQASEGYTRKGAERELRALVLQAQLPVPRFNYTLAGRERDAVWLEHHLVLEIDGFASHGTRRAFHHDRRRDQELAAIGFLPLRATWPQLTTEPVALVARLAGALAHAGRRAA